MHELIFWLTEHWGKKITAGSIAMLLLILFDKFVKDLIINHIKRMFHLEDGIERYAARQIRIEQKVDMLLQKEGLIWNGNAEIDTNGVPSYKTLLRSYLVRKVAVQTAKKYMRWLNMKKINKALLLPLLSAIALFVKEAFGYNISDELVNTAADIILYLIMFAGLFIHPKKKDKDVFLQETGE